MDFPAKPNNQIAVLPKRREARLPECPDAGY
jgi:hypothetical protein